VKDEYPRTRVEAVRAVAKISNPRSADLALSALDYPMDRFLDYAIWLSINDLAELWVAAIEKGDWKWDGREKQLEFGLKAIEPAQAGRVLAKVLKDKPLDENASGPWLDLIAAAGSQQQLGELLNRILRAHSIVPGEAKALKSLSEAARLRQLSPPSDRERIGICSTIQTTRSAPARFALRDNGSCRSSLPNFLRSPQNRMLLRQCATSPFSLCATSADLKSQTA
jgi:hypothetical protein